MANKPKAEQEGPQPVNAVIVAAKASGRVTIHGRRMFMEPPDHAPVVRDDAGCGQCWCAPIDDVPMFIMRNRDAVTAVDLRIVLSWVVAFLAEAQQDVLAAQAEAAIN